MEVYNTVLQSNFDATMMNKVYLCGLYQTERDAVLAIFQKISELYRNDEDVRIDLFKMKEPTIANLKLLCDKLEMVNFLIERQLIVIQ